MGKMWLKPYESDDFKAELEHLWQQLKPLYEQIHAYVRRKLRLVSPSCCSMKYLQISEASYC